MRLGAVLYVYKGEWGLPSIDFECLRVLCLVKFTRVPLRIETNSNPLSSGAGKLPYLEIGNKKFVGYREIKKLLDKEGYPIDAKLQEKEKCLSESYSNWVFSSLHAYYHYFLFGEPNNFDITRSFYAKRTPFPFNFYYPSSYQKEAYNIVYTLGGFEIDDNLDQHGAEYLTTRAKKCVNVLSKQLGRNVWFLGEQFSELDVIVYSYLSVLSKIPLPNNPIQNHIKACPNLVNFINRISRDVFKKELYNSINSSQDENASADNSLLTATERMFLESEHQTKILAGMAALVAMTSYAITKVFFKKKFSNHQAYYDGFNYDDDDEVEDDDMY